MAAKNNLVLTLQIIMIGACCFLLFLLVVNFPYPSPVIKPLLEPKKRWPTQQVAEWVRTNDAPREFLNFFYRDPERTIPEGNNVVAPADGEVTSITRQGEKIYIVIALTFWDVHVQRHPADGMVMEVLEKGDTFMDGEGRNMVFLKEKTSPVQKVISYKTDWGEMKVRLITSLLARRIEVWAKPLQKSVKGERLGRILLGSTVVLEMPQDMGIVIKKGVRVVAGETIISTGWLR